MENVSDTSLKEITVDVFEYEKAYVAFLDVLGFSNFMKSADSAIIASIYKDTIDESLQQLDSLFKKANLNIKTQVMSDSIVLSVSPTDNQLESHLISIRCLSIAVCYIQFYLTLQNIFIRGGISYGDIFFSNDGFVCGPALVDAVDFEDLAIYPRVIFDPSIASNLNLDCSSLVSRINIEKKDEKFIFEAHSKLDEKLRDYLFVNFAVILFRDPKKVAYVPQSVDKILNNVMQGQQLIKHKDKYDWLSKYLHSLGFI